MQDEYTEAAQYSDDDDLAFLERDARRYNKAFREEEEAKRI